MAVIPAMHTARETVRGGELRGGRSLAGHAGAGGLRARRITRSALYM